MKVMNSEVLIVGAGISGLICAIKYAELDRANNVLVVDAEDGKCKVRPIIMPLAVKSALRSVKALRPYISRLSKYLVDSIRIKPFDEIITSGDTYMVNYTEILYILQEICRNMNIQIRYHSQVVSINALQNYVELANSDRINYGQLVLARGPVSKEDRGLVTWYPTYIDSDVNQYDIYIPRVMEPNADPTHARSIILPTPSSLPSTEGKTIAIGTSGGYVDFLTYESYFYKVESAIVAAKSLARKNCDIFYEEMDHTYNEIKISLQLRGMINSKRGVVITPEMSTVLRDIWLYNTDTYSHLAQLLTKKGE